MGRHTRRPSRPDERNDDDIHSQAEPYRSRSVVGVRRGRLWFEWGRLDDNHECLRDRRLGEWRLLVAHDLAGGDQVGRRLGEERSDEERAADSGQRCAKSATETLSSDLKGLGKPDTQAGQQAKDSLDQLSTSLQKDVTTIENAVKGVSGVSGVVAAVSTLTTTLATMGTQVKATFTDLQGLDKGELKDAFASSSACNSLTGDAGK